MLSGKKIVLGVCGSIAAYKAAFLIRLLTKAGAEVKVIMTASASDFISPLTLATLSKNPVLRQFIANDQGEWNNHVELGLWADLMLIAPATAHSIGKAANGICDNLLLATYLSARCPVYWAPAMDLDMYQHPSTFQNIEKLRSFGDSIIDAEDGELASGLEGKGRMAEPENIVKALAAHFDKESQSQLAGKKVLLTAGPTYEAIDPVRFIGNHSSGKMGYALAEKLAEKGAEVHLISGPTSLSVQHKNIRLIRVQSAVEMFNEARQLYPDCHIGIMAAAVADYRPAEVADKKIKKSDDDLHIRLQKNPDIAAQLGKDKKPGQLLIGFALETDNERENAKGKLEKKNFDMIVLNSLQEKGAGFGHNTNKVTLLYRDGKMEEGELKSKQEVANDIVQAVIAMLH